MSVPQAAIESVASAFPPNVYTQADIGRLLGVENPVVKRLLEAPHIKTRCLMLDAEPASTTLMPADNLASLDKRFKTGVATFGIRAAKEAMTRADVKPGDIGVVVAVTSSGLALPGVSAILIRDLGLNRRAQRADLVGMGCNAGMTGLRTISQMLAARPLGTVGLLLCCEVNSALYMRDETVGTGIVNSLFGDGAVGVIVRSVDPTKPTTSTPVADNKNIASNPSSTSLSDAAAAVIVTPRALSPPRLRLLDFESATCPELFDDMRYEVDDKVQLYNFKLSKRIPAAVADALVDPVTDLLARSGLVPSDVKHWVVHSGGAAVIEGVIKNMGLQPEALRHTVSVLQDYGNLSSGSLLVSYERLLAEDAANIDRVIRSGDSAVLIGMGPGATIEVGLGVF